MLLPWVSACVFNIAVSVIPSGVLLNVRHLIISHSFKNMFNNKLIVLLGLNNISKKWNFRVRNDHNKNLVAQSSFKLQHFLCSRGYAMDNLDEAQRIHPS